MLQEITLLGKTIQLYGLLNTLAYVAAILLMLLHLKEFKSISTLPVLADRTFNKKRKNDFLHVWGFYALETLVIFGITAAITAILNDPVSLLFLGDRSANFFPYIFFVPLILFLLGVLLKVSPLKLTDYFAPLGALILSIVKLACYFEGCCYGVTISESAPCFVPFYNYSTGNYEVPIQLIETACAVVMFVILLLVRRKKNRKPGLLYPLFMLMYCGSRFISEFWRGDYPAVLGRLTGYHIQCIIGFVLGAVYLFVTSKWGERITAYFETKNKAFLDKQLKKIEKSKPQIQHHAKKRKKK